MLDEQLPQPTTPDDTVPAPDRQTELRAACAANLQQGHAPYMGVALTTRGELDWIMREQGWDGGIDEHTVMYESVAPVQRPDLRGIILRRASLGGARLMRADLSGADLIFADLHDALLIDADLSHARLGRANLHEANLRFAKLNNAICSNADLGGAMMAYTNLSGVRLLRANLRGANLRGARMDSSTVMSESLLDAGTRLGDVVWNGVPLTAVNFEQARTLGDERLLPRPPLPNGKVDRVKRREDRERAVRANRQLAVALRSQGMTEDADVYAYRAQVLQRRALLRQGAVGRWFFSGFLDLLAGYGYKPGRSLIAYLLTIAAFAAGYLLLGQLAGPSFSPIGAFVFSVTSFHGRGFFPGGIPLDDPITILAAAEAFCGLIIEVSFIATFTQRFFAK